MKKNDKTPSRRRFFRQGAMLGGGLLSAPATFAADRDASAPNETLKLIHGLRTIHGNFADKPVPEDQLKSILDATVRAANASNMQSYSIIVSQDPAKVQKLTGYRGPCLLLYCADHNRLIDTAKRLGYEFYADNLDAFITSSTNAILAAQTAVIAAKSLGIDSMLTNGIHRGDIERIWNLLDLPPKACFPLIALILGYPKTEPAHRMGRLSGPGVIHSERFHRLTTSELDEIVQQHDDPARGLGLNEDWKGKGYKHYLDWFYKDWVRGAKPATAEGAICKRLKKSGYIDPAG